MGSWQALFLKRKSGNREKNIEDKAKQEIPEGKNPPKIHKK
jgi:hypothetical protein